MNVSFDWMLLLPEIVLCAGGVVLLLVDAVAPATRRSFTALAVLTAAASAWSVYYVTPGRTFTDDARTFTGLLETSAVTAAFSYVVLVATVLCLLASIVIATIKLA